MKSQNEDHVRQYPPIQGDNSCDTVLTNQRPGCSCWPRPGGCCSSSASSAAPPPRTSASRARSGPPGAGGEIIVLFTQLYIWKQLASSTLEHFRPLLTFTLCTNCTNHIFYFWQFSVQLFLFTCFQYFIKVCLLRAMQTVRFSCKIFFQLPQWS